jgi:hypothetical protein
MPDILHIPARPDAPVACDMRAATDTPDERLREYGRLFERALVRRSRGSDSVVLVFRDEPEVRGWVADLVRREAACCPFVDYRVEVAGDEVIWTTANTEQRDAVDVMLDAFHDLPAEPCIEIVVR